MGRVTGGDYRDPKGSKHLNPRLFIFIFIFKGRDEGIGYEWKKSESVSALYASQDPRTE